MSHVRKGDWKWGKSVRLCAHGHRIFHDDVSRRWAIADNSAGLPENTEDGVLWLDLDAGVTISFVDSDSPTKPRVVDVVRGSIAVYRQAPGERSFVSLQPAAIVTLARETGCAVKLGADAELLKLLANLVSLAPMERRELRQPTTIREYIDRGNFETLSHADHVHLHSLCVAETKRPGKFEGEPAWVPFFYDVSMLGGADEDDDKGYRFVLNDLDRKTFPELWDVYGVSISVDDQGFVRGKTVKL